MFHLLLYVGIFSLCSSYYLTSTQKRHISNVLQHPDSSTHMKNKVKKILVSKYSYWAIRQANIFRKKYNMRNNYVANSELIQSSLLGLTKSMKYYDGRVSVPHYASKYIQGELYKAFTRRHIGGRFKHHEMMNQKKKTVNYTQVQLYQQEQPHTVIIKSNIGLKNKEHKLFIMYIRGFLSTLRPIDRYIFLLRYDIFSGQILRKHKEIGKLVSLSYKAVHRSVQNTKNEFELYDNLQTYSYKIYLE